MANTGTKVARLIAVLIAALIGCAIGGAILWIVNAGLLGEAIKWIFIALGIIVVISTIPALVSSIKHVKEKLGWLSLVLSIVSMALGIVMIFEQQYLPIIVGLYLLAFPIIRIVLAKDHFGQTRSEAPLLILGILVILLGFGTMANVLFTVGGWVIIGLSAIYAIFGTISALKN